MWTFLKTAIKYIVGIYVFFFLLLYFTDSSSSSSNQTFVQKSNENSTTQTYKSRDEVKKSDFILTGVKGKWINDRFRVLGDVKNIGTIPAGVRIQAKALDRYGETIDSRKYYPNGSDNIDPNDSVGIEFTLTKDESAVDVEVKIISTHIW